MAQPTKKLNINAAPMIKKLEVMVRTRMRSGLLGAYVSVFKGVSGLEFDGYRAYTQDDDASLIDWKASVRSRQTLVKEFVETKELEVFFLIDVSGSMVFGSTQKLKNEYAAELALSLAYVILINGDKVGYALFNDNIVTHKRPAKGTVQFTRLNTELNNASNYGGGYNIERALHFVDSYIQKKGIMLIIISDFIGPKNNWLKQLKLTAQKFDVVAINIRDPRDRELPKDIGQVLVQDPYSKEKLVIDSALISNFYEHYVKKEEKELENLFTKLNIDSLTIPTNKEFIDPIVNLFSKRRAAWK